VKRIQAGLIDFERQTALFPEWRAAMLAAIRKHAALADWRARAVDDFGRMWIEAAAYTLDVVSFYDEVFSHDSYVRSAILPESLRDLIGLLGYIPRPAVAASVLLAAIAEGRKPVTLPSGTAFRSGAFDGNPPQVFELTAPATIEPALNSWTLQPVRFTTLPSEDTYNEQDFLLVKAGTASVKKDEVVLLTAPDYASAFKVLAVDPHTGADGESHTKLTLNRGLLMLSSTPISAMRLQKPVQTAGPFTLPSESGPAISEAYMEGAWLPYGNEIVLDSVYRQIRAGQFVLVSRESEYRWFRVKAAREVLWASGSEVSTEIENSDGTTSTITAPAPLAPVTVIGLEGFLSEPWHSSEVSPANWSAVAPEELTIHFGMIPAGEITVEARIELASSDPLIALPPRATPVSAPGRFLMEDANGDGLAMSASLDFTNGALTLAQGESWEPPFRVPLKLYGNVIDAVRGETVSNEVLGVGDGSIANQQFSPKKSPVTYLTSSASTSGVAGTMRVSVDGIEWKEVPSFFGVAADAEVFIVRLDEDGKATITFGDGVRGKRLRTGSVVTASYRFGAGAAAPPPGSITQIARSAPGLKSIRGPVAAFGGGDAEAPEDVQTNGPRSALLLGRAVSLLDLEAAAARQPGVEAVQAEWRWNEEKQRPVAQIYYIGDAGLEPAIQAALSGLTEEYTPIAVDPAEPLPRELSLDIAIDELYLEDDVLPAVRTALIDDATGLLSRENIGIGAALFRSRIYERVLSVAGTTSVRSVLVDGEPFPGDDAVTGQTYGITPGAGRYFDFETGGLILNGRAS
jgi:predicted phage baseplate assembly protein